MTSKGGLKEPIYCAVVCFNDDPTSECIVSFSSRLARDNFLESLEEDRFAVLRGCFEK